VKRQIDRFPAVSDDGHKTTIIILQEMIAVGTRDDPGATGPGMKEARTIDGYACSYVNDDSFEIVNDPRHMGVVVHRVRPAK